MICREWGVRRRGDYEEDRQKGVSVYREGQGGVVEEKSELGDMRVE